MCKWRSRKPRVWRSRGSASSKWEKVQVTLSGTVLMPGLLSILYQPEAPCSMLMPGLLSMFNTNPIPILALLARCHQLRSLHIWEMQITFSSALNSRFTGWAAMCPWFQGAVPIKLIWPSIEHITLSAPPSPQSPSHPPPRPGTLPTIAWHITQRLTPWLAIFASNFHLRSYACYAGHWLIFWLLHICMGLPRSQIASSEFYKFFLLPIIATLPSLTYILGLWQYLQLLSDSKQLLLEVAQLSKHQH